jgi:hypothetical protein
MLGEKQIEALTVAMVVAPGVYARNRMFELFTTAGARRARARAAVVRGIVPQLGRATEITLEASSGVATDTSYELRYLIPSMRLTRVVELSAAELAALRVVAERGDVHVLRSDAEDKDIIAKALARLMDGDVSLDVARVAREEILAADARGYADGETRDSAPPGE